MSTDANTIELLSGLYGFGAIEVDEPAPSAVRVTISEHHEDERVSVLSRWVAVMHVARMTAGKHNKHDPNVWLNLQGAFDPPPGVLGGDILPQGQLLIVRAAWPEGSPSADVIHNGVGTLSARQLVSQL